MQYCPRCHVYIRGHKTCCPLCRNPLIEKETPPDMDPAPAFPVLEKHRVSGVSLTRILTFLMILCENLMVFFALQNREAGVSAHWPYVCGFLCFFAWVDFLIARYFRSNLIFLVTFEAYLGMALCLAADHLTVPYRGWAVAWCVPFGMIALEAATVLLGWSEGLHMVDYAVYLFVDTILSLLQLIPIQRHTNPQPLPALISLVVLLAYLAFILVFRGRDLRNAITKFLNF